MYTTVSELLTDLKALAGKSMEFSDALKYLREKMPAYTFRWEENKTSASKLAITLKSWRYHDITTLEGRANGIIIEYPACKLLSIGQPVALHCKNGAAELKKIKLSQYSTTVSNIMDGTTVTLYNYAGTWHMSSSHGISIGGMKWISLKTYQEAFEECVGETLDEFCATYDTSRCYTYLFRHKDFHPLVDEYNTVWFVQSTDLNTLVISNENPRANLDGAKNKYNGLHRATFTASNNTYYNIDKECNNALYNYGRHGVTNFGYVINFENNDHVPIVIESKLYLMIKSCFYNLPANLKPKDPIERRNILLVNAYLLHRNHLLKLKLTPEISTAVATVKKNIQDITNDVITSLRMNKDIIRDPANPKYKAIYDYVYDNIRKMKINVYNEKAELTVFDYAANKSLTELYAALL